MHDFFTLMVEDDSGRIFAVTVTLGVIVLSIPVLAIVFGAIHNMVISTVRDQEQTRRELAAYVAEGSLSPDDAAMILSAGRGPLKAARSRRDFVQGGKRGALA